MPDVDITQGEADALIAMEKHRAERSSYEFQGPEERLAIPLISFDRRETFVVDVTRSQIKLLKATYQTRARQATILMRLDLDGPPHRNPDGEEVPCPHLHIYREGFADKWAHPAPIEKYPDTSNLFSTFQIFMQDCNVTLPPQVALRLF